MADGCADGWDTKFEAEDFTAAVGVWKPDAVKCKWKHWAIWEAQGGVTAGDVDHFNVMDFDVFGPDDALRVMYAVEAALVSGVGAVFLPRRTYLLRTPITVNVGPGQSLRIFSDFATLRVDTSGNFWPPDSPPMLTLSSDLRPLTVERLHLNGMWAAPSGILLTGFNGPSALMQNVSAQFFNGDGIRVFQCHTPSFWDCTSDHNKGDGWSIVGCNGGSFIACVARYNKGSGFSICGSSDCWYGGSFLSHIQSEFNGGSGICVWDGDPAPSDGHATGVRIRDGWIEGNGKNGVRVAAWDVEVSGLKIVPGGDDYSQNRGIWVDKEASGVMIRDCVVSGATDKISGAHFYVPHDDAGQARYVFFDHNYTNIGENSVTASCLEDKSRAGLVTPKGG